MTEVCKVKNGIASEIMKDIFKLQNPLYNLISSCNHFRRENIKTAHYGFTVRKISWYKNVGACAE